MHGLYDVTISRSVHIINYIDSLFLVIYDQRLGQSLWENHPLYHVIYESRLVYEISIIHSITAFSSFITTVLTKCWYISRYTASKPSLNNDGRKKRPHTAHSQILNLAKDSWMAEGISRPNSFSVGGESVHQTSSCNIVCKFRMINVNRTTQRLNQRTYKIY